MVAGKIRGGQRRDAYSLSLRFCEEDKSNSLSREPPLRAVSGNFPHPPPPHPPNRVPISPLHFQPSVLIYTFSYTFLPVSDSLCAG